MVAVFPKGACAVFSLIIFLGSPIGDPLNGAGNALFRTCIHYQKVDVIVRHHVVQYGYSTRLVRLVQPLDPATAVFTQEKFPLMTPVGDVPDETGNGVAIGTGHDRCPYSISMFLPLKNAI